MENEKKKGQSAGSIFLNMFLKTFVIIFGLLIIAFGVFFITQVVKNKAKKTEPVTTAGENQLTEVEAPDDLITGEITAAATEEPSEERISTKDAKIAVLNSTDVSGLAGRWCETLNEDGYENTEASDFIYNIEDTEIYVTQEGLGDELLDYFTSATVSTGRVPDGASIDTSAYDIIIIIGNSDSDH